MKKLSIVIPVYNVEDYLPKCLDSVITDDPENYEIITVNDGSTDNSPLVLEEYCARYPRLIRTVTKENGGLGSARNAGIMAAEGEYIAFLDSDDWLSAYAVQDMLSVCGGEAFDICFFDFRAVNENGDEIEYVRGANKAGEFSLESNPDILLCRMNAWNKIYRLSLFRDNGIFYPDRAWYEDVFTTPKLYHRAGRMIYSDRCWYNYLLRSGSIMNNGNISRNLEIIDAVETMNSYFTDAGVFERYRDQLEYFSFYNELVAATVRVNLIDPDSAAQDDLLAYFLEKFPDYHNNPYIQTMSKKYRLLDFLITRKKHHALNLVMKLNGLVRH